MNIKLTRLSLAVTVFAAAVLTACGGGGGSPGANGSNGGNPPTLGGTSGTLNVSLTDAPACGFDAVNVTVSKVRVHQSASAADADNGWSEVVLNPARKINLLNLTNGVLDPLGSTSVPSGRYTQVRLVLDPNTANGFANSVVPTATKVETTLETPPGVVSGIQIASNFDITAGQSYSLILDFDACRSVVTKPAGGYALAPVVSVVASAFNGITGYVSTVIAGGNVNVTAQRGGTIIGATVADTVTGAFTLARLTPGAYDVVFTSSGRGAAVVGNVLVANATTTTPISTTSAPITLPASLGRSISGVVSLSPLASSVTPYVTASQMVIEGKTVVIQAQSANPSTGSYLIEGLPIVAPQYAPFSTALPLVFGPANVSPGAGAYRLDASATGYVGKTVTPVNVSAANQTGVNVQLTK